MLLLNSMADDQTFTAYQKRGYEFNILMALDKNVRPWLLTKYCNCLFGKSERSKFDFVIEGGEWFANEDVFTIDIIRTRKNLLLSFQNKLFNIIINRLNNGLYVYGYFDEYYVKTKCAYHNHHFKHSFLVYGCDNRARIFYAIGYTNNFKFEKYTISYDDFMIALTSLKQIDLTFVRVNPNFNFKIKIESIYYGLYDYIHSICSTGLYEANVVYGINTLYEFARYVQNTAESQNILDMRYSKFFMEFKNFMLERLEYLYNNAYIGNEYEEYSEVCKVFQSIHMLFIKYNMTRDPTIPQRIIQMIYDSTNKERIILSNVLYQLKSTLLKYNSQNYI